MTGLTAMRLTCQVGHGASLLMVTAWRSHDTAISAAMSWASPIDIRAARTAP